MSEHELEQAGEDAELAYIGLYVFPEEKAALEEMAAKNDRSLSAEARRILRGSLNSSGYELPYRPFPRGGRKPKARAG